MCLVIHLYVIHTIANVHKHTLNICRTVAQFTKCSKCFVWRTRTFWIISFAFVSRLYVLLNYGNKYIIQILFLPSFHCPSWVVLMISNVPVTKLCNDLIAHIKIYRIWSLNTHYIVYTCRSIFYSIACSSRIHTYSIPLYHAHAISYLKFVFVHFSCGFNFTTHSGISVTLKNYCSKLMGYGQSTQYSHSLRPLSLHLITISAGIWTKAKWWIGYSWYTILA